MAKKLSQFDEITDVDEEIDVVVGHSPSAGKNVKIKVKNLTTGLRQRVDDLETDVAALQDAQGSGVIAYETKADMDADTSQSEGTPAMVYNDTASNNGYYRWDAGTSAWVKRDEFYATTLDPTDTNEAVTGKAVGKYTAQNLWPDPYFQKTTKDTTPFSIVDWDGTGNFTFTDPDADGARQLKIDRDIDTDNVIVGPEVELSAMGFKPGDVFRFDVFAEGAGAARVSIDFRDENGDRISLTYHGNESDVSSKTRLSASEEIPTGAETARINFERRNTDQPQYWDGLIIVNGDIEIEEPVKGAFRGVIPDELDPDNSQNPVTGKSVANFTSQNLWDDPHFQKVEIGEPIFSLIDWDGDTDDTTLTDPDSDYEARKLKLDSGDTSDLFLGIHFDLLMLGLKEGDPLTAIIYAESEASVRLSLAFYDDSGSRVGSIEYGSSESEISSRTKIIKEHDIPSDAVEVRVGIERLGGSDEPLYVDTLVITQGYNIPDPPMIKGRFDADLEEERTDDAIKKANNAIRRRETVDLLTGANDYQKYPNEINSIIRGKGDTVEPTNFDGKDYVNFWVRDSFSYVFKSDASDGNLGKDARWNYSGIDSDPIHRFGAWIYIPAPDKIDQDQSRFEVKQEDDTGSSLQTRFLYLSNLEKGWNFVQERGLNYEQGSITRIRLLLYTNEPTQINVGHFFLEHREKGQILIVNDHGYKGFRDYAYPDCKALGIPVTWALQPGQYAEGTVDTEKLNEADILDLALDGNSAFSMHYYRGSDSGSTSDMTAQELRRDTLRCIRWLKRKGLIDRYVWRAAFLQNKAPEHKAIRDLVVAYRSGTESSGSSPTTFPFENNPFDLGSYMIHGRSNSSIDQRFDGLKRSRGFLIVYTHDIVPDGEGGSTHMEESEWDYFHSKLETGVNEGWLEGVTMDQLVAGDPRNLSVTTHPDFIRATSV